MSAISLIESALRGRELTEGRIQDIDTPSLFSLAGTQRKTGTLAFSNKEVRKEIFLDNGSMIWASSNRVDDRLGQYLLWKGCISYQDFDACSRLVVKGKRLGAVLVERDVLSAEGLSDHLRGQAMQIALELFDWTDGRFQFTHTPLASPSHSYPPVDWRHLIIPGIRQIKSWSRIIRGISMNAHVTFHIAHGFQTGDLPLDLIDLSVLELFRRRCTLAEAMGRKDVTDFDLFRSFWLLSLIGALTHERDASKVHAVPEIDMYAELCSFASVEGGEKEDLTYCTGEGAPFFPETLRRIWSEARTGNLEVQIADRTYGLFFTAGDLAAAGLICAQTGDEPPSAPGMQTILDIAWKAVTAEAYSASFCPVPTDKKMLPAPCLEARELLFDSLDWIPDQEVIVQAVKGLAGPGPLVVPPAQRSNRDFLLSTTEGFILSLVDGKTDVQAIFQLSTLSEPECARVLYQLLALGFVEPGLEECGSGEQKPERSNRKDDVPRDKKAWGARHGEVPEDVLLAFATSLEYLDDHTSLGLKPEATEEEIRGAYLNLVKRFHPDKAQNATSRKLRDRILRRILGSYKRLLKEAADRSGTSSAPQTDPGATAKPRLREPVPPVQGAAVSVRRRYAQDAFRRGEAFNNNGESFNALECFRIAVNACPFEAPYQYALGLALAKNPRWRGEAEEALLKARGLAPKNPEIYVSLGEIYRDGGKMAKAIEMFKQALFLDSGNKTARRGLKELRKLTASF